MKVFNDILDIFKYYWGEIGTDLFIHEVYLSDTIDDNRTDSKVCASKIEIGKRLTIKDINDIITTSSQIRWILNYSKFII